MAHPRLSATLILVRDDPFEVLLVRRHAKAVFASALVFPGGVVEPEDHDAEWMPLITPPLADAHAGLSDSERALRIAALRETYEETSLLIAKHADGTDVSQPPSPAEPGRQHIAFREVVRGSGGKLALGDIHPVAHWVTPKVVPKRFDTHFYLGVAPRDQVPVFDGGETVGLEWVAPQEIVERVAAGERSIIFPTLMNLTWLAAYDSSAEAIEAAKKRRIVTVTPRVEFRADGSRCLHIPAEAGYGLTEFVEPA